MLVNGYDNIGLALIGKPFNIGCDSLKKVKVFKLLECTCTP